MPGLKRVWLVVESLEPSRLYSLKQGASCLLTDLAVQQEDGQLWKLLFLTGLFLGGWSPAQESDAASSSGPQGP